MATHLPIQEEMATSTHLFKRGWSPIFWSSLSIYLPTYLSKRKQPPTYISKRRWPPTYQSRRRWPPRPTYLGWDGDLSIYLGHPITHLGGDGTYLLTYLSRRRWLPTYISRRRWPPTYLSRRGWPPLPTYLRGDGHLSTYFGVVYLLIYLPTYLGGNGNPPDYLGGDDHLCLLI